MHLANNTIVSHSRQFAASMQMVPGAQTINFAQEDLHRTLLDMTGGSGPDVGVEAVGMHYTKSVLSKVHQAADQMCISSATCSLPPDLGASLPTSTCLPASACSAAHVSAALLTLFVNILQAEQKLWLQTDPSDMMNDIIFNVRKVHSEVLLSGASICLTS
jgi:hypothetical protein